jgi:tetratricopeptide (TPR) repeat protein
MEGSMEEESPTVEESPTDPDRPPASSPESSKTKSSRRKRGNRLLIVGIVIVSLASFAVLGLFVRSLLTVNSRPLQSVEQRDAVVAVAAAQANPRNIGAQMAASSTSVLAGEYEQALLYANRAVKLDPKSLEAKLAKADALRGGGDLKQARVLLQEIRKQDADSTGMYARATLILAVIDEAEGKLPAAIEDLKVAQAADPTNTDIIVHLAGLQERTGKKDDAAESYGEALKYIPDLERALVALRAMKSGPADYQLAMIAWEAGNKDEARRLMEQAAKESPKIAWVQVALGDFRVLIGDTEGARVAYQAALSVDPANEEAKARLDSL